MGVKPSAARSTAAIAWSIGASCGSESVTFPVSQPDRKTTVTARRRWMIRGMVRRIWANRHSATPGSLIQAGNSPVPLCASCSLSGTLHSTIRRLVRLASSFLGSRECLRHVVHRGNGPEINLAGEERLPRSPACENVTPGQRLGSGPQDDPGGALLAAPLRVPAGVTS